MNKRNLTFEAFRAIFIIYMIVHHFDYYFADNIPHFSKALKDICFEGFIGVNFFFMLSGLGCVLGYKDKLESNATTPFGFLWNRIINLWPTYMLLLIVSLFLYHAKIGSMHFFEHVFMIQSLLLSGKSVFMYNAAAWCISACMFFYVLFCFIYRINFKKSLTITALILFFILINTLSYGSYTGNLPLLFYTNPLFRSLEFLTGMTIALYFREHKLIASAKLQIISILVFILFLLIGTYSGIPLYWRWSLFYLFPCAFLLFAFYGETEFSVKVFGAKILQWLAKISMVIYLVHQEIISGLKILLPENLKHLYFQYFIPFGAIWVIL